MKLRVELATQFRDSEGIAGPDTAPVDSAA
jgi:hypothetical protein